VRNLEAAGVKKSTYEGFLFLLSNKVTKHIGFTSESMENSEISFSLWDV
jgi:hypothetical protein